MLVAIVDTDIGGANSLNDLLCKYRDDNNLSFDVHLLSAGEELESHLKAHDKSLLFMGINGDYERDIAYCAHLSENYSNATLIFYSRSTAHAMEAYNVFAADYLIKPLGYKRLEKSLSRLPSDLFGDVRYVMINEGKTNIKVPIISIHFIEVYRNYCLVHTENDIYKSRCTLESIKSELNDDRFLQCHRSFVVNFDYVLESTGDFFTFKNGKTVPIPRQARTAVNSSFEDYLFAKRKKGV